MNWNILKLFFFLTWDMHSGNPHQSRVPTEGSPSMHPGRTPLVQNPHGPAPWTHLAPHAPQPPLPSAKGSPGPTCTCDPTRGERAASLLCSTRVGRAVSPVWPSCMPSRCCTFVWGPLTKIPCHCCCLKGNLPGAERCSSPRGPLWWGTTALLRPPQSPGPQAWSRKEHRHSLR